LTDVQRKAIQENAQSIVLTNAQLRVSATNCAARFRGNRTRENILADKTPIADYFGSTPIPAELGSGDKSVSDIFSLVKKSAFENISGRLGPQIEERYPRIRTDVELQRSARQAIQSESDAAVTRVASELIDLCLTVANNPPEPQRLSPAAQTRVHEVPEQQQQTRAAHDLQAPHNRSAAPVKANAANSHAAPHQSSPNPRHQQQAAAAEEERFDEEGLRLPEGDWVKADGTPYYYSQTENLYFHAASGQFYDPSNEMWYDPEKDEWYSEETDEAY
jgi:hypothetical protein